MLRFELAMLRFKVAMLRFEVAMLRFELAMLRFGRAGSGTAGAAREVWRQKPSKLELSKTRTHMCENWYSLRLYR
jgi:hypothetical protein